MVETVSWLGWLALKNEFLMKTSHPVIPLQRPWTQFLDYNTVEQKYTYVLKAKVILVEIKNILI